MGKEVVAREMLLSFQLVQHSSSNLPPSLSSCILALHYLFSSPFPILKLYTR